MAVSMAGSNCSSCEKRGTSEATDRRLSEWENKSGSVEITSSSVLPSFCSFVNGEIGGEAYTREELSFAGAQKPGKRSEEKEELGVRSIVLAEEVNESTFFNSGGERSEATVNRAESFA